MRPVKSTVVSRAAHSHTGHVSAFNLVVSEVIQPIWRGGVAELRGAKEALAGTFYYAEAAVRRKRR